MHSWRRAWVWNPGGVHVKSRFSELAWWEERVLHLDGCRCCSLSFITRAFHQLYDVHMSIECEDFAHKRASGKTTRRVNQLIIISQMGCRARRSNLYGREQNRRLRLPRKRSLVSLGKWKRRLSGKGGRTVRAGMRSLRETDLGNKMTNAFL